MADQVDRRGIVYSPPTFERHSRALDAVAAQIVTRDPRRGIGRFPGVAPGAWGLLSSGTISAASGTSLGSGTVTLCDSSGVPYPEALSVPVRNAGAAISASGGAVIVPLEWTSGEWSVCGCEAGEPALSCSPCNIPQKDLVVTATNLFFGTADIPLIYTAPGTWASGCPPRNLIYAVSCQGFAVRFAISYFISGSCPTGQRQTCSTTGANPLNIILDSWTCSPFEFHYRVTGTSCPALSSNGYTTFVVHE